MGDLFASGRAADLILGLMVLEGAFLATYRWATGRGLAIPALASNLAAGASLVLALRAALTNAAWEWVAAWLGVALVAHLIDLAVRWKG